MTSEIDFRKQRDFWELLNSPRPTKLYNWFRGSDSTFSGKHCSWSHNDFHSTSTSREEGFCGKLNLTEHFLKARHVVSEVFRVTMKCPSCGNPELQEHHRFCCSCGFNLALATSKVSNTSPEQFTATAGKLQSFSLLSLPRNKSDTRHEIRK